MSLCRGRTLGGLWVRPYDYILARSLLDLGHILFIFFIYICPFSLTFVSADTELSATCTWGETVPVKKSIRRAFFFLVLTAEAIQNRLYFTVKHSNIFIWKTVEREIYKKIYILPNPQHGLCILLKFLSSGSSCSTLLLPSRRNVLTLLFREILAYFASVKLDLNTCTFVKVIGDSIFNAL